MTDTTTKKGPFARLDMRELASNRLFDEVPCYISVQDRDLRIIDMNRKMIEDFGDRISEHCYEAFKDRDKPCAGCVVEKTFADGYEHRDEEALIDKDGRVRDVIVNTRTVRTHTGKVLGVMEVFTDITEKKQMQACLQDSFERFNTLFDQVPCFISVQDKDFRILEVNRQFKESFSSNPEGFCYEVYKRRNKPCDPCPVARTFEDGEVHASEEVIIDDQGNEINVIVHTSPIYDSEGRVSSVMEVSTDITQIKQLQDRLANLGGLVAGIAHSIKNVIDGLRGGVYIVNIGFRDNDEENVRTGWEMVERNVDRISSMIMDMLYCAKERVPNPKPVPMDEVAREVIQLFKGRAEMAGVSLKADIGDDIGEVMAEPKDIHSLLSNLVTNAIDACCSDEDEDKTHEVKLMLSREGDEVLVTVTDNGIGMDEDTKRKLFNLFFSTKGAFGTGLGLLVAHKVATEHGGNISVESKPGKGSAFNIKLPAHFKPAEAAVS